MNTNNPFQLVSADQNPNQHDPAAACGRLHQRRLPPALHDLSKSAKYFRLDKSLETAINTALAVAAPLLITGEPGTGKTQVAYYLSWYFGIPVFEYQVKSISTAEDLKYDFDAVAYLRTAQQTATTGVAPDRHQFLRKKALWQAYEHDTTSVLLIDEIDKAPRDFPNDLLQELDNHRFKDPFSDDYIEPSENRLPIVVVTSNVERRLPDAFLRRCIFCHIKLTEELVRKAVNARFHANPGTDAADFPILDEGLKEAALVRFWELRDTEISKKPATAELLVWLTVLSARGVTEAELRDSELAELPGVTVLIKDRADLERLQAL